MSFARGGRGGAYNLGGLALGRDANHVPGETDPLHSGDQQSRGIELPAAQAVDGGAREGVVVVVPGLAEGGEGEPEDVGRLVLDLEPAGSEEVADGVDAPGDVVDEEDANQPAPEQAGGGAQQGAGEQVAGQRRDRRDPGRPG